MAETMIQFESLGSRTSSGFVDTIDTLKMADANKHTLAQQACAKYNR